MSKRMCPKCSGTKTHRCKTGTCIHCDTCGHAWHPKATPEPVDHAALERATAAFKQTSLSEQVSHLDYVLGNQNFKLEDWVELDNRFEVLDAATIERDGIAYAYGYIVGIADSFRLSVLPLIKVAHLAIKAEEEERKQLQKALR